MSDHNNRPDLELERLVMADREQAVADHLRAMFAQIKGALSATDGNLLLSVKALVDENDALRRKLDEPGGDSATLERIKGELQDVSDAAYERAQERDQALSELGALRTELVAANVAAQEMRDQRDRARGQVSTMNTALTARTEAMNKAHEELAEVRRALGLSPETASAIRVTLDCEYSDGKGRRIVLKDTGAPSADAGKDFEVPTVAPETHARVCAEFKDRVLAAHEDGFRAGVSCVRRVLMDLQFMPDSMVRVDKELDKRLGGQVPMTYTAHALFAAERLYCVYCEPNSFPFNAEPVIIIKKGNTP